MRRSWAALLAVASTVLAISEVPAQQVPAAPATVNAVWVERELGFNYSGFTSYYSCDGLRAKLEWLLGELGARPGFKVSTRGCLRLSGPELMPGARIVATVPLEATAATEATAQFPARVKRIEFRSARTGTGELQDGDCEFMEQARRQLFPPLGVRVVQGQASCSPNQLTLGAVQLTVEVLEPVPAS